MKNAITTIIFGVGFVNVDEALEALRAVAVPLSYGPDGEVRDIVMGVETESTHSPNGYRGLPTALSLKALLGTTYSSSNLLGSFNGKICVSGLAGGAPDVVHPEKVRVEKSDRGLLLTVFEGFDVVGFPIVWKFQTMNSEQVERMLAQNEA